MRELRKRRARFLSLTQIPIPSLHMLSPINLKEGRVGPQVRVVRRKGGKDPTAGNTSFLLVISNQVRVDHVQYHLASRTNSSSNNNNHHLKIQ